MWLGLESCAMKAIACFAALSIILQTVSLGQTGSCSVTGLPPHRVRVSPELADKLIIHKAEIVCPRVVMPARVTGTVVARVLIDTHGDVLHSSIVSGAAMLRKPVLDAVRKYKYQPYSLNDKAVEVETTVAVTMDSYLDCHYE